MAAAGYNPIYWNGVVTNCELFAGAALALRETNEVRRVREEQPPERIVYIRCADPYYYYRGGWSGWDWSTHNTNIINHAPAPEKRSKTEEEKKEDSARAALWVGGVVAAFAAFAVGVFYGQYSDESETLAWVHDQKMSAQDFAAPSAVYNLLTQREKIHQHNYENSRNRLFSAVTVLTGAVSLVAGGLVVAPMLITAGYAALFAGTVIGLGNLGLHWGDEKRNKVLCADMLRPQGLVQAAKEQLGESRYQPLYPDAPPPSYYAPSAPPAYG